MNMESVFEGQLKKDGDNKPSDVSRELENLRRNLVGTKNPSLKSEPDKEQVDREQMLIFKDIKRTMMQEAEKISALTEEKIKRKAKLAAGSRPVDVACETLSWNFLTKELQAKVETLKQKSFKLKDETDSQILNLQQQLEDKSAQLVAMEQLRVEEAKAAVQKPEISASQAKDPGFFK